MRKATRERWILRVGVGVGVIGVGEMIVWTAVFGLWGFLAGATTVAVGLAICGITPRRLFRAILP